MLWHNKMYKPINPHLLIGHALGYPAWPQPIFITQAHGRPLLTELVYNKASLVPDISIAPGAVSTLS